MRYRLMLCAPAGFVVTLSWVSFSFLIALWSHPLLWKLAQLTCPITLFVPRALKWHWVVLSNVPVYVLVGLTLEGLLRLTNLRSAAEER
jgi:hypothetical protein